MNIFDEINDWSAEELLSRINLPMAKDGKSHICPLCDNGAGGGSGDGIKPRNSKGQTRWKCFKCGKDFSNFDLAATVFGFDAERETAEAAKRLKEEFNLYDDNEISFSSRKNLSSKVSSALVVDKKLKATAMREQKKSAVESEPKNYAKMYKFCRDNAKKFLAKRGGSYRGLTAETFEKYGLGVHPEFGIDGQEKLPTLIIPYDDYHFVARAIDSDRRPTQHGQGAGIYMPLPLDLTCPNFITEGEIDALSVIQASGNFFDLRCIATGGASKYSKVVLELEKLFGDAEAKPSFIVLFDNDKTGKDNAVNLVTELRAAGYPAETFFFEERTAGDEYIVKSRDGTEERIKIPKVDANDLLKKSREKLIAPLINAIEFLEKPLKEQKAAMKAATKKENLEINTPAESKIDEPKLEDTDDSTETNMSELEKLSVAEYFKTKYFEDAAFEAQYSLRKTGFANLDGDTEKFKEQKQCFAPGIYILGATPGAGKTTWAMQLLDNLAANETCIFFSYEMSQAKLCRKLIARELFRRKRAGEAILTLGNDDIRRAGINSEDVNRVVADLAKTAKNLHVDEVCWDIDKLLEKILSLTSNLKKPPVIAIDYLQFVPSKNKKATAKETIDDIMLKLRDYQRQSNATIIIISAFNRANAQKLEASFSSFRESSSIEYSADVLWALEPANGDGEGAMHETMKKKIRPMKLRCLKNRHGGVYEVFFNYYAAHDYFEPCEKEDSDEGRDYEY